MLRALALAAGAAIFGSVCPKIAHAELGAGTPAEKPDAKPQTGLNETELSKGFQNPVGDLVSIPLPFAMNFNTGPTSRTEYVFSINPFVPVNLSKDVRLISRGVLPFLDTPVGAAGRDSGLGDTSLSFFFAPNRNQKVSFGVGPSLLLPTATSGSLGTGKWSLGPAGAIVATEGPMVVGGVVSQVWSFAGNVVRDEVSLLSLQPFAFYNFGRGWSVGTSPNITANFSQNASNTWTLPLGGGIAKVVKVDPNAAFSFQVQGYGNVISPDTGPDASVRFVVAGLLPN